MNNLVEKIKKLSSRKLRENAAFFHNENHIRKINLKKSVKRIADTRKSDLIFDPIGYDDWEWFISNDYNSLKELLFKKYIPNKQLLLNMPKKNLTFRPVAYLLPSDSIIYQGVVDKIIEHKKDKFSKQVYSNIILDVNKETVFHEPILHWLEMRANIRRQYLKDNSFYFSADISGYFENIKISKLIDILKFYTGRNEQDYLGYLDQLLKKWQFAYSQGIVQPHTASSILGKVYLTSIDSHLLYLGKKYNRYVDEFHILTNEKHKLLKITEELGSLLRELGLNLNSAKGNIVIGEAILDTVSVDSDFFDGVNYIQNVLNDNELAMKFINKRFRKFIKEYLAGKDVNLKIFRYCLRRYIRENDYRAIDFCLSLLDGNFEQTVDIVKYLGCFINSVEHGEKIREAVLAYIENTERNIYPWVQVWYLELLLKIDIGKIFNIESIWSIAMNKNNDELSRSIALLIIAKHKNDHDLMFIIDMLKEEKSVIVKRALIACSSKLPSTIKNEILVIDDKDQIDIIVLKNTCKIMNLYLLHEN